MRVLVDASLFVYLNVPMPDEQATARRLALEEPLLTEHEVFTNLLVLDEVVYVSRRKYGVDEKETLEFVDRAILSSRRAPPSPREASTASPRPPLRCRTSGACRTSR